MRKVQNCQNKKILFLGGSITCGARSTDYEKKSWAYLSFEKIGRELYGDHVEMLNASISGTGSFIGAFRLEEHVIAYHPDLVFVEFAVNDRADSINQPDLVISSMDYIVQRLKKDNPNIAITFVYTTSRGKNAAHVHTVVAQHYNIPEIDLQTPMQARIDSGENTWDDFLADAAHPNDNGHAFYAQHVAKAVLANKERFLAPVKDAPSIAPYTMTQPHILYAKDATSMSGFALQPVDDEVRTKHLPCLFIREAAVTSNVGDSITFDFEGACFAVYHRINNYGGRLSVTIDGEPAGTVDCYYNYSSGRKNGGEYLSRYNKLSIGKGKHTVVITVTEQNEQSRGSDIYIAGIFVG